MKQYLNLLNKILNDGVEKESGRANMPNTIGISHAVIRMDLQEGFPLLTTKKMYLKGIIHELLWFLRGETNIKYLVDNNVNIWNGDSYRWYLKYYDEAIKLAKAINVPEELNPRGDWSKPFSQEEFVETIKSGELDFSVASLMNSNYVLGDLGKVYGHQWRNQNGVDQVKDVVEGLKNNPYCRYHIIDGWNKADFKDMALPPCHLLYQFIVRPLSLEERREIWNERIKGLQFILTWGGDKTESDALDEQNIPKFYLDLNMYQRSVDTPLGCPFNIASMSLLLMIMSKVSNMLPGVATWIGGDTHIYVNQVNDVVKQLCRDPYPLPKLLINKDLKTLDDIQALTIDDFELIDYQSHPAIKFELSVGLKKIDYV